MRPARRPIGQGVKLRDPIGAAASSANADSPDPAPAATSDPPQQPQEAPAIPGDLVTVGRIVDSYGVRGWVKVESYNQAQDSVLGRVRCLSLIHI